MDVSHLESVCFLPLQILTVRLFGCRLLFPLLDDAQLQLNKPINVSALCKRARDENDSPLEQQFRIKVFRFVLLYRSVTFK